ncbi:hypothetical protein GGI12_004645 [Dipsacomyces acuminosporus]|nr:hypothetical protein GGI12_004645 [Dipsacomyces acuminosporus]
MFSVLGTQSEILAFLEDKPTAVFCSMSSRTYTSDISVEVHRSDANSPYSCLWRWWYDSGYRQLVIRARRTFTPRDFNPLVSIHVPQGVLLKEVADLLKSAGCRGSHNMVRDKRLNIKVMDRSRSHMTDSQLRHWFCIGESDVNGDSQSALLPPYRPHADEYQLPPPYTA